ncbi:hypothetical protein YTPLAS18_06180 [Nitrospira sp.]|nr:hypothetical protein YTPLAS18_06180 [Nitrospira sp.]
MVGLGVLVLVVGFNAPAYLAASVSFGKEEPKAQDREAFEVEREVYSTACQYRVELAEAALGYIAAQAQLTFLRLGDRLIVNIVNGHRAIDELSREVEAALERGWQCGHHHAVDRAWSDIR